MLHYLYIYNTSLYFFMFTVILGFLKTKKIFLLSSNDALFWFLKKN